MNDLTKIFSKLYKQWNYGKKKWIEAFGSDEGYNEWAISVILKSNRPI